MYFYLIYLNQIPMDPQSGNKLMSSFLFDTFLRSNGDFLKIAILSIHIDQKRSQFSIEAALTVKLETLKNSTQSLYKKYYRKKVKSCNSI